MQARKYETAAALRRAITDRLKKIAETEGVRVSRLFRHLAFDRFLSRLFHAKKSTWALKGGYAMELRMPHARETKDIDLTMQEVSVSKLHALITEAVSEDLGDFFVFEVEKVRGLFTPPQGGTRFRVNALIDDRSFARFHVDIGIGDAIIEPLEKANSRDWLSFAGIKCPAFTVISREQQFAEKIHAYSFPFKDRTNSRVRDLVDLVILIRDGKLSISKVKEAVKQTFSTYGGKAPPSKLASPPPIWKELFPKLANDCRLEISLEDAFKLTNDYYSNLNL